MRSLNRAEVLGNVTRDVELRYTENGSAVATFTVATNRAFKNGAGESIEESEFHRVVAWSKLAEIASQILRRGSRVYVSGRLQTRKYTNKDGNEAHITEIVADDLIATDSKNNGGGGEEL